MCNDPPEVGFKSRSAVRVQSALPKGVRPVIFSSSLFSTFSLRPAADYILLLLLSAPLFLSPRRLFSLPASALHPRAEGRIPSDGELE